MSSFTLDNIKHDNIHIGEYTYGMPYVILNTNKCHVYIGKFCSIAEKVTIITANHRADWITTYPFGWLIDSIPKNPDHPIPKGDIRIGNDVWIGLGAIILPGIAIGDGAIIGAGSVVTKDVDDYEIVAGNPARHIRYRFNEGQIKALKRIQWWNWHIEKIESHMALLESASIDEFIKIAGGESMGLIDKLKQGIYTKLQNKY